MTKETTAELREIITDLRRSVAWMDLVFANLSESICVIDKHGRVTFANDAFADLAGQVRILLLGQEWQEVVILRGKHGLKLDLDTIRTAWSSENDKNLNGNYTLRTNTIAELTAHYMPKLDQMVFVIRDVTDAEHTKHQLLQTIKDVREQRRELREANLKVEAMLESISDGIVATDDEGRIVFMNPRAEELFGVVEKKVQGVALIEALPFLDEHGQVIAQKDRPLYKALKTGKKVISASDKAYYYNRNGKQIALSVAIAPLILHQHLTGAIGIYRDITGEHEIDRMKTEFISLASHQLRTPLSAINWFSEILLDEDTGTLNPDQRGYAQNILESSRRMTELVNSLLNISRIESGRIIVDPKPTDLRELVDGILKDLQPKIQEKSQSLIVSVHPDMEQIKIDPRLITQVYINLLTNAIKYTPAGGEITVFISMQDGDVVSQISDNGYGIPAAQQEKVFQKFFRGENIVKFETDGNGLGMYLVKSIVESSGGRIWFKSEENKGTTFWFTIPGSGMKAHEGEVTLD